MSSRFRWSSQRPTLFDMPTVYIRSADRPKFHRNDQCRLLNKRPARGTPNPIRAVELAELSRPRPCRACYPDAPRADTARRFCPICNIQRVLPCEHNGGVRVTTEITYNYVSLLKNPGDTALRTFWVWPEQAWFYELAS